MFKANAKVLINGDTPAVVTSVNPDACWVKTVEDNPKTLYIAKYKLIPVVKCIETMYNSSLNEPMPYEV